MISQAWGKFAGWKVIETFLERPNTRTHIKGLAQSLKISPNTAQIYMNLYENSGVLISERIANSRQFSLNNEDFLAVAMKRLWILLQLKDIGFAKKMAKSNTSMSTLVIFGAFAKGDFTDHSDIDILVISQGSVNDEPIKEMEKRLGRQADVTKMSASEWRQMVKSQNKFAVSVMRNHAILWGSEL